MIWLIKNELSYCKWLILIWLAATLAFCFVFANLSEPVDLLHGYMLLNVFVAGIVVLEIWRKTIELDADRFLVLPLSPAQIIMARCSVLAIFLGLSYTLGLVFILWRVLGGESVSLMRLVGFYAVPLVFVSAAYVWIHFKPFLKKRQMIILRIYEGHMALSSITVIVDYNAYWWVFTVAALLYTVGALLWIYKINSRFSAGKALQT